MKPSSSSIRSFPMPHGSGHVLRWLALGSLAITLASTGCGDEPTIRDNRNSSGAGNAGAGGTAVGTSSSSSSSGDGGSGGGGGSPMPKDPLPLRVLNWNVHNLENDKDDSGAPGETIVSTAEYTSHRQAVGIVLKEVDADIVVLAEVENKAVLDDLNKTELGNKYLAASLIDGNDYRGVDIGVLSKVPIDSVVSHEGDAFPLNGTQGPNYYFSRDCPEIHIQFNGRKMVFLGAHFKAKSNDDPIKRLAEAQRTRAIADGLAKQDPSRAIAVLGDFNDTPDSPPYLAVVGSGATKFTDTTLSIAQANRWSYNFQGKLELIDYQIVNPVMGPMLETQSVTIRHTTNVDAASDHSPVIATYMVN